MTTQFELFTRFKVSPVVTDYKTDYFNTTSKSGAELKQARTRAENQTDKVLNIFRDNPDEAFSVWQIYDILHESGHDDSKSGIGRAITGLTKAGHLVKAGKKVNGPHDETSFTWKLK